MKRVVLPIVVVLLIASAAVLVYRAVKPASRKTAELLPANTLAFVDVPDIRRTAQRWPQTELAQIFAEPQVQSFFERPTAALPGHAEVAAFTDSLNKIEPSHFFFAAMSGSASLLPPIVTGLQYTGSRDELDKWIGKLRTEAEESWPTAKPDVEKYAGGDIETFTTPSFSAGLAYRGNWVFLSTDTTLLKFVLDHLGAGTDSQSLAELPGFKGVLDKLPADSDSFWFVRPSLMADKVAAIEMMANPTADTQSSVSKLQASDAGGGSLKLDGPVMRDFSYAIVASATAQQPLAFDVLKASSHDSIVAADARISDALTGATLPDSKADPTGIYTLIRSYAQTFTAQGLGTQQFAQAFGPEAGILVDWPAGAMIPAPLGVIDIRDHALAQKFLDTLATIQFGAGLELTRQESAGISYYSMPPTGLGLFSLQATIGLTPVFAALNTDSIKTAAARWDLNTQGLDTTDDYKQAAALVAKPTAGFGYLDTKSTFTRLYGLIKGVAAMGFIPRLGDYVDMSKFPDEATITKHLTPIVSSQVVLDGGVRSESAGPITSTQCSEIVCAAFGFGAVEVIQQQLKGHSVPFAGFPFSIFGAGAQPSPSLPPASATTPPSSTSTPGPILPPPAPAPSATPSPAGP